MSVHTFTYLGIPVEYTLIRKRIKNINIRITENEEIVVSAPYKASVRLVNEFVEGKAEWIIRNLAVVERYNSSKPDDAIYSGKKVYYLGKAYEINVVESALKSISIKDNVIQIHTFYEEKSEELKNQYISFLKDEAEKIFSDIIDFCYEKMKYEDIQKPDFVIKSMKTRWGSCSYLKNVITLNLQLIKTDEECIKQVVFHELTHLKVHNHGEKFYAVYEKYMPNWREVKRRLEVSFKDGI